MFFNSKDHNLHVLMFRAIKLQREISETCYSSADAYYNAKDALRRLRAFIAEKTELQYDPMGVWFGRQSN